MDKGWQGLGNLRMEGEEEKDAGLSGKGDRNTENVSRQGPSGPPVKATGTRKARPINRGKARRYGKMAAMRRGWRTESGGFLEFDFGGVAEGIEDAEKEIRRDVLGVAVHDGGDAGA